MISGSGNGWPTKLAEVDLCPAAVATRHRAIYGVTMVPLGWHQRR